MSRTRALLFSFVPIIAAIALVIACALLGFRQYYVISVIVIALLLFPVFFLFEARRPQAREVVTVAVMTSLVIASRAAFIWIPHVKPMAGLIMIAGIALGPQTGCLIGALSALGSGLIFGIGMWTPWQMIAFGMAGFVFGLIGKQRHVSSGLNSISGKSVIGLAVIGFVYVVCVLGPTLDTCTLFTVFRAITPENTLAVYGAGLPVNAIHGIATAITLLLATKPLLAVLERLSIKYGLFEQ